MSACFYLALATISPGTYKAHLTLYDNTGFLTARAWHLASVPALMLALTQLCWAGRSHCELGRHTSRLVRQLLFGAWKGWWGGGG